LRQAEPESFEYVYIAPPQYKDLWLNTLMLLDENPGHLYPDGTAIVQIDRLERQDVTLIRWFQ